ncbi:MAG: hypothetical protein ACREIU_09125 [Planctomycetota bacterium]
MKLRRQALRIALLGPALAAASACRSTAEPEPRLYLKPGVDWSRYAVAYVEEATVSTTARRSAKVDAILSELKLLAEIALSDALAETGRFERVVSREGEIEPGRTLVCRCAMKVHFGNTALRVIFGFGAGRSGLWMTPSLHDATTGERHLSYQGWGGAFQGWGVEILAKMHEDIPAIAQYFAGLLPPPP